MSKKVQLPVRADSNYGKATEFMRKNQIYTKTMLMDFFKGMTNKDGELLNEAQASASTGVMLSPRESSQTGDGLGRGNMSNPWGHLAYNDKIARKVDKETGKKLEQKFRFRFRSEALNRQTRKRTFSTTQEKEIAKTPVKTSAKTKKTVTA
jgi:hypothetical protein